MPEASDPAGLGVEPPPLPEVVDPLVDGLVEGLVELLLLDGLVDDVLPPAPVVSVLLDELDPGVVALLPDASAPLDDDPAP